VAGGALAISALAEPVHGKVRGLGESRAR